jgi:hypothetical protein
MTLLVRHILSLPFSLLSLLLLALIACFCCCHCICVDSMMRHQTVSCQNAYFLTLSIRITFSDRQWPRKVRRLSRYWASHFSTRRHTRPQPLLLNQLKQRWGKERAEMNTPESTTSDNFEE